MSETPDLSDSQHELIHHLPASTQALADQLGITKSSVRDRISRLREKGIRIPNDKDSGLYHLADEQKVRRVSTKHTGTKTREANNYITEVEKTILRRLEARDPLVASQTPTSGGEDVVLHLTDLHIGDVVEDQHGNVVYDTDTAQEVVRHVTRETLRLIDSYSPGVDTLHLLWGGDMATNEALYDSQPYDIEALMADQLSAVVNSLTQQAKTFAEHFPTVNILYQPGNHGKTRASGVSKQANIDLVAARWIDDRLRESGYENIDFGVSEATWYRTFPIRGGEWTGFLTHGQDAQQHVDATAASGRDWRGWLNEFDFSVAYRGHFHSSRIEPVQSGPLVVESPSPKPSDEWTSRIGLGSVDGVPKRLATVHGADDSSPLTWSRFIDATGMG